MRKRSSVNVFAFMMVMVAGFAFLPAVPAHAMCPADMVGYWKLDETAAGTYADFIKGNNGMGNPDPTPADGTVDGAQEFIRDDSTVPPTGLGIDVTATSAFNWLETDSFSVELWVKTDSVVPTTGNQVLIGRTDDANLQWWIGLQNGTGNASFRINDPTGGANDIVQVGIGDSLTADTDWHHVVLVRDTTPDPDTHRLYVDGVAQGTVVAQNQTGGFASATAPLTIGYLGGAFPGFYFDGLIDEVAIYDRALGSTEIGEHYTAGLGGDDLCGGVDSPGAPYPLATLSLWPLDEAAGPTYVDMVGGKNGTGSPAAPTAADGTVDGAQEFIRDDSVTPSTGMGIDVDATSAFNWLGTDSFTIELWVKTDGVLPTADTKNEVLIGRRDDPNLQWWIGLEDGTGKASYRIRDAAGTNASTPQVGIGVNLYEDTEWHHVVLVRDTTPDPDTNTLYVDGAVQGTPLAQDFAGGFGSATAPLNIGHLLDDFYFDGLIDEVAIYDRALGLTEIGEHYTEGLDGNGVATLRPEPTANAGADQSVTEGDTVELDGSGSSDADGTIVSYQWQQLTGPTVTLANATTDTASFEAPTVDAAGAILTFRLTVTDNEGQSSSDTTSVEVNDTTTTTPTPPPTTGGGGGGGGCFISTLF
jgi:hypothetical protein